MKILKPKAVTNSDSPVYCPDPSDYRPELLAQSLGKQKEQFRQYEYQVRLVKWSDRPHYIDSVWYILSVATPITHPLFATGSRYSYK